MEAFRRRYVEREIIAPGIAAIVGTATDRSVTANLQHKIATKTLLPVTDVADAARDGLVAAWDGGVRLDDAEAAAGAHVTKGRAVDRAVKLSVLHYHAKAPTITPVAVQRSFALTIPDLPFDLVGTMDVQEAAMVRDTKTSAKAPSADAAATSLQLTAYALAVSVIDAVPPPAVALDYLVDTTTAKAITVSATRTTDDFAALVARARTIAAALTAGVFVPVPPDHWMCTPRWCGYFHTCRYARRPVSVGF